MEHFVFQLHAFAQVHQNFIFDAPGRIRGQLNVARRAEGVDRLD